MLILIDGYNVIAPAAPPGRQPRGGDRGATGDWLHAERMRLLERLSDHLDSVLAARTHVIFDASGPIRPRPEEFRVRGIHVRFAVNHDEADDLIEELIAAHHFPKRLTVVSSDHRLQVAAARAGATAFDSQPWLDALLDGKLMLAIAWPLRSEADVREAQSLASQHDKPDRIGPEEIHQWMQAFGLSAAECQRLADSESSAGGQAPLQERSGAGQQQEADRVAETGRQQETRRSQETGQGRGRGRAGRPNAAAPNRPSTPEQGGQRRTSKQAPPKREPPPESYNPFPPGYGEDLLP